MKKLSEILFSSAEELWQEAAEKDFVVQMAKGTLAIERYRHYMLQDYLYLEDYSKLLEKARTHAGNSELREFIARVTRSVEEELESVHRPNMKKIGLTEREIQSCHMESVLKEYVSYLSFCLEKYGLLAALTALLQCSWGYAYLGETVSKRFPDELRSSPYKNWFDAYTSSDYVLANQAWIDRVDREWIELKEKTEAHMCEIFRTCATYENRFWDCL